MSMYDCEKCGGAIGMFCYCTPEKTTPSSNLELASELWAMSQGSNPIDVATSAIAAELDAFADRIRPQHLTAAVETWHEKADRLKKCVDYATSGQDLMTFSLRLSEHLSSEPAPPQPIAELQAKMEEGWND